MSMFRWLIVSLFLVSSAALAPTPAWAADDAAQAQSDATVQLPRTNTEIRVWYNRQVSAIPALNQAWLAEGLSAEERARRAQDIRHDARIKARSYIWWPRTTKKACRAMPPMRRSSPAPAAPTRNTMKSMVFARRLRRPDCATPCL